MARKKKTLSAYEVMKHTRATMPTAEEWYKSKKKKSKKKK